MLAGRMPRCLVGWLVCGAVLAGAGHSALAVESASSASTAVVATPPAAPGETSFSAELADRLKQFDAAERKPEAVVSLFGALELWDFLDDRSALDRFFAHVESSQALPDVRARARFLRSLLLDRFGQTKEAERLRRELGLVTRFWMVGPFDNEGRAGHAAVYGPEKSAFDPAQHFSGKERQVGWRPLPAIAHQGALPLDLVLRPDSSATAYVTTVLRTEKPERIALRLGSSGPIKVWINGTLVFEKEIYRVAHFDQDVAGGELHAGDNRILIKVSGTEGPLTLIVRTSRPDGEPLAFESSVDATRLEAVTDAHAAAPKFSVSSLQAMLEEAAKKRPRDATALSSLGLYLKHLQPEDPEKHRAEALLERAAEREHSGTAYLRLAGTKTDENEVRKTLEAGLEGGGDAVLLYELGEVYYRGHREQRAEELWRAALKADPNDYRPILRLVELASERGLPSLGATLLDPLGAAHPSLRVLRAQASLSLRRGHRTEVEALLQRIAEADFDDVDALAQLYGFARGRGDNALAEKLLDRIDRQRPDRLQTKIDRSELCEDSGKLDEAERALRELQSVVVDDARLTERHGRLLHRMGKDDAAVAELERSLELKPQNPELRTYLTELLPLSKGNHGAGDLARTYAEDVRAVMARTADRVFGKSEGESARVLLDSSVTRVLPNGLSENFQQRIVEILDSRGAREQGDFDVRYTPDTQSIELRAARVYKKNGDVLEAARAGERDMSEPWYGLYYDVRAEVVEFPALEPGDVLDIEYSVADVGRRNLIGDYFGELHFLQEELPRLDTRYLLIAPDTRSLYFNQPKLAGLVQKVENVGQNEKLYSFSAPDVAKVEIEPGMPGFSDVAAYLHVSTFRSWEDVAAWYQGLVRPQLEPNKALTKAAEDAVRGLRDERAKIRAIYDLVVRSTRYVGLEFGIHGYQPYRVSQIFARKFGDCKDKASLLKVMLKQVGIESTLVLARTRQGGDLDPLPASLAPFDHAIVYVPKYELFLDGTAEFSGSSELPAQDQDIPVLLVSESRLGRTPVLPAIQNESEVRWHVVLDEKGGAKIEEHQRVSGQAAHEWRSHYQAPGEQREKYEQGWNLKHPGAHVEQVSLPGLSDLEKPVEAMAQIAVPRWAHANEEGGLTAPALGHEGELLRSYARLSVRKHDLILGYPFRQKELLTLTVPAGFRVQQLPDKRSFSSPFGTFSIQAQSKGTTVQVTALLEVPRHRVSAKEYPEFRRFLSEVDAAIGQDLILVPKTQKDKK